jgi:HK97 family phage major capsid protein
MTNYSPPSDSTKTLKERRSRTYGRMEALMDAVNGGRKLTPGERDEYERLERDLRGIDATVKIRKDSKRRDKGSKADARIEGRPNELVPPGHMGTWYRRAVENGVMANEGTDRDMNRFLGERMGFAKPGIETRTILEDTAGSGQALSPTRYLADTIDVLLPNTLMGQLGVHTVAMDREQVQMPVYTSTYAGPQWIAEAGSLSLDAGPAFAPLLLSAPGGWKFYTAVSLEMAMDAFLQGTLDQWLAEAASRKLAVALDTSLLLGVAGNVGVPGLINESGFVTRKQTGDAGIIGLAPVATTELGVIAEQAVKKNIPVEDLAFISNIGVHEAFERIPVASFGKFFEDPPLVADTPWLTSENSALAYVETDPATANTVAQTGGTFSSLYCGPWARSTYFGIRLDLGASLMRLDQRLIDQGLIGYFSMFRGSIRQAYPSTYTRTIGVITV